MTDPIHQHLDGANAPLSPDERARADALARTLDAAAAHLRAVPAPDLASRVMAALPRQAPAPRPGSMVNTSDLRAEVRRANLAGELRNTGEVGRY